MLESFYIIDNAGIGVYEYNYFGSKNREKIEFQLLAGLITALIEFSQTTLMDNIQVIKLLQSKLVFTADEKYPKCYAIGLYSISDHDHAIKKANKKLFKAFNKCYKNVIEEPPTVRANYKIDFDPISVLRYKGILPMYLPINWKYVTFVTLLFLGIMSGIYFASPSIVLDIIENGIHNTKTYYLSVVIYGLPYILTGFCTGRRLHGLIATSIINVIITTALIISLQKPLYKLKLEGIDFTYLLSMVCGFFGGYLGEFFFLNKYIKSPKKKKKKD